MPPPAELIAGPIDLWVQDAAASVTHPEISDPPPVAWVSLGTNISEDGVTFSRSESIEKRKTLDSPLTKKLFRTEYDVELSLNLQDMSIATLARIENGATVATTAAGSGTGGFNEYTGGRGFDIKVLQSPHSWHVPVRQRHEPPDACALHAHHGGRHGAVRQERCRNRCDDLPRPGQRPHDRLLHVARTERSSGIETP